jgi:uncharacterized protein YbcC (UPF0753/DUF2309 family)
MSTERDVRAAIEAAAESVGRAWPLHSFVTANPLAGFEDRPFREAVREGERLFSATGYPTAETFRRALTEGRIDTGILESELSAHGYDSDPETLLDTMADAAGDDGSGTRPETTAADNVDRIVTKWLAAFLDQGEAHWPMPDREQGFYAAVRTVARHDSEIPAGTLQDLPDDPTAAVAALLGERPENRWPEVLESQLAALPGWTGFLKGRIDDDAAWQSAYPITLAGYLAIRLALCDALGAPLAPEKDSRTKPSDGEALPEAFLSAWEATYRRELVDALTDASEAQAANDAEATAGDGSRPDAQLVFCIDTRSEILRRHVERAGDYETYGYAGFFGIPMEYEGYDADVPTAAHPPILDAEHRIADRPSDDEGGARAAHDRWSSVFDAGRDAIDALKTNAATAFSFVESAGLGYGTALTARTLLPARLHDALDALSSDVPDTHEFCVPSLDHDPDAGHDLPEGLTLEERVEYAATAFDLMGWTEFARVAVFVGHASQTANNPFDSSLDCGACAGNPGGPNARVLAAICNEEAVRSRLRDRGIEIPSDTVFLAGEHNTTTDEVELYTGPVPESHIADVERLRADLETARHGATDERAGDMGADTGTGVRETHRRAADWAETRPEWGLAGNAAFVIGPRALTEGLDLDGRSFLHSYDWRTDPDGDALEGILAGPMVVTQWINTQYYFATVDTAAYGSGSKVTHNPVGNVGVYQGNGGDLLPGLPLQSVMSADDELYHQPIRLSTVVHAPVERVSGILSAHEHLRDLLDNGWLSLTVVDPQRDHRALHYAGDLEWTPLEGSGPTEAGEPIATVAADD